jgi:sigma-E factor negative regulatory protein RseA
MNRDDSTDRAWQRQALSALADGEPGQADHACNAWQNDPQARADWHAYHVIGELLRSDDVRIAPQRDAQFLGRLRGRLASEPVLPGSVAASRWSHWRRAWSAPMAVAAGFAAIAGVLVVMRVSAPDAGRQDRAAQLAGGVLTSSVTASQGVAAAPAASSMAVALTRDGRLIRNPDLDRYLAAHKQFSDSSVLAVPGGMLRSAAVAVPDR